MTPQADASGARTPPDAERIFAALAEHDVEYVLVGGLAVQTHGHMRTTFDVDIYPRPTPENFERLAVALIALEARALNPDSEELAISASMLARATLWQFDTAHGAIDVIHDAPGAPAYDRLRANAMEVRLGKLDLAVAGREDLMMPETDVAGAIACCERIVRELESARVAGVEGFSASAGVATFERAYSPAELVGTATTALDRARAEGGGKVVASEQTDGTIGSDQRDAVSALSIALLERDRYTGEHSDSVVGLVGSVARGLGLDDEEVERIKAAAQLHDIGKVAIPDEILNKPSGLTPDEWKVMKDHTVIGERIMRAIPGLGNVARIVRHEHERWDGGGYPDGIAGEEIPVGARIILACDAYHAMVSDRPYRKAMSHAEAVDELLKNAGSQFDPSVVEILVGALYGARQAGAVV